tara:strand:+ start:218 stop:1096 length:879 start_codon:yes stop_codon:yes gene_type:complete
LKKILITGGNGLLGQSLRLLLSKKKYEIIATGLNSDRLNTHTHIYRPLDISIQKDCESILNYYMPDIIINTAAITDVDYCELNQEKCLNINTHSINHFLSFCKKNNKKFIQISTDFLFDGKLGPYCEGAKQNPINYYGFSKMMAERKIINANLSSFSIIRTCLVYGNQNDSNNILMWVKRKLDMSENLNIVVDQFRTPTLVSDLSKAIFQIIENDLKGVYNISSGEYLSIFDFVCNIVNAFGYDPSLIQKCKSNKINQKAERPKKSGLKVEKAVRDFDFLPTKMDVFLKSIT